MKDEWTEALVALLDALDEAFGPGVTRLEFGNGWVLEFKERRP